MTPKPRPVSKPREVVNIISSRQVIIDTAIKNLGGHIEIREHLNGSFSVWYPDPGFTPCAPTCGEKHKHTFKQGHVESEYEPTDRADADDWAYQLAEGREVKYVKVGAKAPKAKEVETEETS